MTTAVSTYRKECSNRQKHVSAFPAFDRQICKCGRVYVRREK